MTVQAVSKTLHGDKLFNEPTITCPSCKTDIKLNESLAGPLIAATREEYEQRIAQTNAAIALREEELERQRHEVALAREGVESLVAEKVRIERAHIAVDEARKAKLLLLADLDERDRKVAELEETLKARDDKLEQAQKQQAEFLTKQRALEDERREMALTIERKVQEGLDAVRAKARSDAEDGLKMKIVEKEEQIAGMQRQIEDLKRRAEQGSQQLQGEALELELEGLISSRFPVDVIEPVAKGEFGGDVLQRVVGPTGQQCGAMAFACEMSLPTTVRTNHLQPLHPLESAGCVNRIPAELAAQGGETDNLMIDATHLKAHRTAASLLKKGLYPDVSDAAEADCPPSCK